VVEGLLDAGHAYRSTAGPDDVRAFKEANGNRGFRGTDEGTGAVRLRVPDEGATTVVDVIRGETPFENALQDDLVIARADGTPVYHLAVVVDDHDAGITHVVRGADHYSNTPKHVLIQQAMGAGTPVYAHLPLLHGPDGKKLSKRHGAASVQELRDRGYLPEAVRNYLALLGWGFDDETTFFTTEELQRNFSLEKVSKSPAVFDEQKLRWMNGRYVRELAVEELTARLEALTGRSGLGAAVAVTQEKISTLDEFWPLARAFFEEPADDGAAFDKFIVPEAGAQALDASRAALDAVPEPWTPEDVEPALRDAVERSGMKAKQVFQPLRVALTGTTISPGIFETVALVGRERALARIDAALDRRRGA
jgi:glutamyl-tRNA synthetase